MLTDLVDSLGESGTYVVVEIIDSRPVPGLLDLFACWMNSELSAGKVARARHVRMHAGDVVCARIHGETMLGVARLFLRLSSLVERDTFYVCLQVLEKQDSGRWTKPSTEPITIGFDSIDCAVAWVEVGDEIVPRMPNA